MRIHRSGLIFVILIGVGACAGDRSADSAAPTGDTTRSRTTSPVELGAAAQLDSGNAAFRAKDFAGALAHYRRSAERQSSLAAAWFGIYMAEGALGHTAAADSALQRVRALDPAAAGAHPGVAEPSGSLPPGHPSLDPAAGPGDKATTTGTR
jgi:hypothetical protein